MSLAGVGDGSKRLPSAEMFCGRPMVEPDRGTWEPSRDVGNDLRSERQPAVDVSSSHALAQCVEGVPLEE
jgi:hypothetical protein